MAITISEEKKRKNYLIIVLGILILLVILIAIIWKIFLQKPEKILPPITLKSPEIKINFEILKNPILKELQPFEEIKPFTEPVGRENPFLPY